MMSKRAESAAFYISVAINGRLPPIAEKRYSVILRPCALRASRQPELGKQSPTDIFIHIFEAA